MNIKLAGTSISKVSDFRNVVESSMEILDSIDKTEIISGYSLVSIISQILGLNTPIMGSGHSPYSVMSFASEIKAKERLFNRVFKLPLKEKRLIVDEMYDMMAPYMLNQVDEYIELLSVTKNRNLVRTDYEKKKYLRQYKTKYSLLSKLMKLVNRSGGDFAHIVHYGYPEDLLREYYFLGGMPVSVAKKWRENSYPIVNEITIKNIPFLKGKTKTEIRGHIIFISNYTKELLESSKLRKKKIFQAALLAKQLGAKTVGMGGLVASFAEGGHWLSEQIPGIGFTTGHAYTIGNILDIADTVVSKTGLNIKKSTVAIVGAAGSIGSGCVKLMAERGPKNILLIDLNMFGALSRLNELKGFINKLNKGIKVRISTHIEDLKCADLIIVATNSPTSLIKSEYLKKNAIIIDDSFPKNITRGLLNKRKDIIALEGGIMRVPLTIDLYAARNMPDLMDLPLTRVASCKETYGCFAETMTLGLYGNERNFGLGYADPILAKIILSKAKTLGFSIAPLQCFDEAI